VRDETTCLRDWQWQELSQRSKEATFSRKSHERRHEDVWRFKEGRMYRRDMAVVWTVL